jgi:hypothetical protein
MGGGDWTSVAPHLAPNVGTVRKVPVHASSVRETDSIPLPRLCSVGAGCLLLLVDSVRSLLTVRRDLEHRGFIFVELSARL